MTTLRMLRFLEAEVKAKGMTKGERVQYLRSKGWKSHGTSGVGVWEKDGRSMTTRRATEAQLLADMEAGT